MFKLLNISILLFPKKVQVLTSYVVAVTNTTFFHCENEILYKNLQKCQQNKLYDILKA